MIKSYYFLTKRGANIVATVGFLYWLLFFQDAMPFASVKPELKEDFSLSYKVSLVNTNSTFWAVGENDLMPKLPWLAYTFLRSSWCRKIYPIINMIMYAVLLIGIALDKKRLHMSWFIYSLVTFYYNIAVAIVTHFCMIPHPVASSTAHLIFMAAWQILTMALVFVHLENIDKRLQGATILKI